MFQSQLSRAGYRSVRISPGHHAGLRAYWACLLTVRISDWCPLVLLVDENGKELGMGVSKGGTERRYNTDDWQRCPGYDPEVWQRFVLVLLSIWNVTVVYVVCFVCRLAQDSRTTEHCAGGSVGGGSQFKTYFSWTSLDDKSIIHSSQPPPPQASALSVSLFYFFHRRRCSSSVTPAFKSHISMWC
jgi:hypothetical protein